MARRKAKVDVRPQKGGPLIGWLGQKISGARELEGRVFGVDRYYDLAIDPEAAACTSMLAAAPGSEVSSECHSLTIQSAG